MPSADRFQWFFILLLQKRVDLVVFLIKVRPFTPFYRL